MLEIIIYGAGILFMFFVTTKVARSKADVKDRIKIAFDFDAIIALYIQVGEEACTAEIITSLALVGFSRIPIGFPIGIFCFLGTRCSFCKG